MTGVVALWFAPGYALTCDEIVDMLDVGVPSEVVNEAIFGERAPLRPDELRCLRDAGVPRDVLDAARELPVDPSPAPPPPPSVVRLLAPRAGLSLDPPPVGFDLGRALYDRGLLYSAERVFLGVAHPGDPHLIDAVGRLVAIAGRTRDETAVLTVIDLVEPTDYPQGAWSRLYELRGVKYLDSGRFDEALLDFEHVADDSASYGHAKLRLAEAYVERGKLKSAVKAWRDAYQSESITDDEAALALAHIARIYVEIDRFDNASAFYSNVRSASNVYADASFERAYAELRLGHPKVALAAIDRLTDGQVRDEAWRPEADWLEIRALRAHCRDREADRELRRFVERFTALATELDAVLALAAQVPAEQLYDRLFDTPRGWPLPRALFMRLSNHPELAEHAHRLGRLTQEEVELAAIVAPASLVGELRAGLAEDRLRTLREAGELLVDLLNTEREVLADLLAQATGRRDETWPDAMLIVQPWPYSGLYWADELAYPFPLSTRCAARQARAASE